MTTKRPYAYFALSVVGPDRPGIVAGVSEALFNLGCNIADSSCAMLAGEFAMILIISHPEALNADQLLGQVQPACDALGMTVALRTLTPVEVQRKEPSGELCVVTVYGADKPGIVFTVTKALADRGINIQDLQTKLAGDDDNQVYVMMLEVNLPDSVVFDELQDILATLHEQLQVEVAARIVTPVEL